MATETPHGKGMAGAAAEATDGSVAMPQDSFEQPPKKPLKEPPPEKPSDIRRRSFVILSFWLIVICLGLPIWWMTTTIYRANLPLDSMMQWADGKARRD